jgi:hypothetical protein
MQAQVSISTKQFPTLQRLDVFFPLCEIPNMRGRAGQKLMESHSAG